MIEPPAKEPISNRWYARPVLFVSDIRRALDFYVGKLGFEKQWHEAEGKGGVCQVHRADCEIILCESPDRHDRGRLYVELTREGLDQLLRETIERSTPTEESWWGSDVIKVVDPDGNELLFPRSNE